MLPSPVFIDARRRVPPRSSRGRCSRVQIVARDAFDVHVEPIGHRAVFFQVLLEERDDLFLTRGTRAGDERFVAGDLEILRAIRGEEILDALVARELRRPSGIPELQPSPRRVIAREKPQVRPAGE